MLEDSGARLLLTRSARSRTAARGVDRVRTSARTTEPSAARRRRRSRQPGLRHLHLGLDRPAQGGRRSRTGAPSTLLAWAPRALRPGAERTGVLAVDLGQLRRLGLGALRAALPAARPVLAWPSNAPGRLPDLPGPSPRSRLINTVPSRHRSTLVEPGAGCRARCGRSSLAARRCRAAAGRALRCGRRRGAARTTSTARRGHDLLDAPLVPETLRRAAPVPIGRPIANTRGLRARPRLRAGAGRGAGRAVPRRRGRWPAATSAGRT